MDKNKTSVSQYLLYRLQEFGSKHMFGVCGDFLLGFINQIYKSPVTMINCCNELNAGYAADGYARINGLGAVTTTFTVGELSAINAIAGSYAEQVPVVMIAGSPELRHARANKMLHHTLGDYSIAREMFRKITVACERLDDPLHAPQQIDMALSRCLYYKKPIYFELPADMVTAKCAKPGKFLSIVKTSNPDALAEALSESLHLLKQAKKPIIILGMEIIRHGLQDIVKKFIEKSGFPYCTFVTGKTTLSEDHPQFIGCYKGGWSREYVAEVVDSSDCILLLGGFFIDSDTGGFTAHLEKSKLIQANFEQTNIKNHTYSEIMLSDYIKGLTKAVSAGKLPSGLIPAKTALKDQSKVKVTSGKKLTVKHFFKRVASFLNEEDIVIAEVGDCLYSMAGTLLPKNTTFISQSFYNSIGYTVGAALGTSFSKKRRTILFVGDGSFQLTAQEISTMLRYDLKPIIFLLNNQGYAIERAIHDGPYNDLQPWRYHLIPQALGGEAGINVHTEGELESALKVAENAKKLTFIEINVDKYDFGDTLRLAGSAMAESSKNSYD